MKHRDLARILSALMILALVFALTACAAKPAEPAPEPAVPEAAAPEPAPEPEPEPVHRGDLVGISMPTEALHRWSLDGEQMKALLEQRGYEVDLRFASSDPEAQSFQIGNMIEKGAKVIVIAAIDGDALGTVLNQAKEAGCTIIAYDRPIGSDAVSYYTTFDFFSLFAVQGRFIADRLDLANAGDRVYNIELINGSPDFGNGIYTSFDGVMNELQKYIDAGNLNIVSGLDSVESTAILGWSAEKAQELFENLLSTYYSDKQLDAVWCAYDFLAQGVAAALETTYRNDVYPILTGKDCDIESVRNILDGKQAMSVFKDTRKLAAKAVEMADAIVRGDAVPANAEFTTVDGAHTYPAFYVDPDICTKDNIQELLIDSGYYTAEELGIE